MLKRIESCYDQEELHNIGLEISMSMAPNEVKKPLFIAIEKQLKSLNLLMAESSEIASSDIDFLYED